MCPPPTFPYLGHNQATKAIIILVMPTPTLTPIAILSLIFRPAEPVLLALPEFPVFAEVGDDLPTVVVEAEIFELIAAFVP